jgi:hypothetical protein
MPVAYRKGDKTINDISATVADIVENNQLMPRLR